MAKVHDLKNENIQKIRECFFENIIWTKNALHERTGISLASTTNTLQYLYERHEIQMVGKADSTGGRKSKQYQLNKDLYHIGLVSLRRDGDTYIIHTKSCYLNGDVVNEQEFNSQSGSVHFLHHALETFIGTDIRMRYLVFSIPGIVNDGIVEMCDFEKLTNFPLIPYVLDNWNIDAVMDNDVNMACVGFSKQFPHTKNIALLYQPNVEFIGCGMMIEGKVINGHHNAAGELRFLPTEKHSDHLTEKELLETRIQAVCAVLNPEVIGYHTDFLMDDTNTITIDYPKKYMPKLVYVDDFFDAIDQGLFQTGLHKILDMINMEEK